MCVAFPGRVLSIQDGTAVVDFSGNQIHALTGLVTVKEGDYVLVHAGCIIQTMKQQEAEELAELFMEVNHGINQ